VREQDLGCMVGGEEWSIRVLSLLPVFKPVFCSALGAEEDFRNTTGRTLLNSICNVLKSSTVHI
jgi:hypothetical protein